MMVDDLRKTLDALRSAMPALNRATDEAERIMEEVGDHFEEIGLGITARSAPIRVESESVTHYLEYWRLNGQLRFVVRTDWGGGIDRTPWESCDRETKLRTFAALPGLVESIATRVAFMSEQAGRIRETTESLRDALEVLKAAQPAPAAPTTAFGWASGMTSAERGEGRPEPTDEKPAARRGGRNGSGLTKKQLTRLGITEEQLNQLPEEERKYVIATADM